MARRTRSASASVARIVILQPTVRSIVAGIAADVGAVLAQDGVLVGQRLGRPEDVPHVGVLGDDPQRLLLPAATDHHRQVAPEPAAAAIRRWSKA